eukprot:3742074-Alexandrium_andersonii.AAC.1
MSASLVGSEMCIRDQGGSWAQQASARLRHRDPSDSKPRTAGNTGGKGSTCLLYTSDAADDM